MRRWSDEAFVRWGVGPFENFSYSSRFYTALRGSLHSWCSDGSTHDRRLERKLRLYIDIPIDSHSRLNRMSHRDMLSIKKELSTKERLWVETVASRMGKNAHRIENRKQNLPPATRHGNASVSTQGLCSVDVFFSFSTKYSTIFLWTLVLTAADPGSLTGQHRHANQRHCDD